MLRRSPVLDRFSCKKSLFYRHKVRRHMPLGLSGIGLNRFGVPPSRILIFCDRPTLRRRAMRTGADTLRRNE